MEVLRKFILFCSGAAPQLLKRCPTETGKYIGIGASVLFTSVFAALSCCYALFFVFNFVWLGIAISILWGGMIFNLDRFIVSSMRKGKVAWKDYMIALPRLVLAIVIALVISKPLELKIFEKEINRKLDEKRTEESLKAKASISKSFPEIKETEGKILALKSEIQQKESFRNQLQNEYDAERFGKKTSQTTGIAGIGTNAKKKEIQLDEAQKDLSHTTKINRIKIEAYEKQLADFSTQKAHEFSKQKPAIDKYDGLAARIDALSILTKESSAMNLVNLFIVLLFILIETTPVFVKLISQRGPYDDLLEVREHEFSNYRIEQTAKSNHKTNERLRSFKSEKILFQH